MASFAVGIVTTASNAATIEIVAQAFTTEAVKPILAMLEEFGRARLDASTRF